MISANAKRLKITTLNTVAIGILKPNLAGVTDANESTVISCLTGLSDDDDGFKFESKKKSKKDEIHCSKINIEHLFDWNKRSRR